MESHYDLDIHPILSTSRRRSFLQIAQSIPVDLEESARRCGAFHRARLISSPSLLLRLFFIYTFCLSLRDTAIAALALSIGNLSHQALHQRFMLIAPWLRFLLSQTLQHKVVIPINPLGRRVVIFDASTISRAGSRGTEWRIHLALEPFPTGRFACLT